MPNTSNPRDLPATLGAAVLQFPSPLAAPVIQHPRRGRFPKGVSSIRVAAAQKLARAIAAKEKADKERRENMSSVRSSLNIIAGQVLSERLVGAIVLATTSEGEPRAWLSGNLRTDDRGAADLLLQLLPCLDA